jgi:hypothetical protein
MSPGVVQGRTAVLRTTRWVQLALASRTNQKDRR